jgi:hypothetical protein
MAFYAVQNLSLYPVLPRNIKMTTHKNIIFPCVIYWYENWSLIIEGRTRLRFSKNRAMRELFWPLTEGVINVKRKPY